MHKIDTKIYNERLEEVMMIKILMEKQSYSAPRKGLYELHTTEGWEFLFFHHLQLLEILDAKMRIKKKLCNLSGGATPPTNHTRI
jgi:hypothetical protein